MTTEKKVAGVAITSLVLGILSFILLGILGAIPAVICGHLAKSRIKASQGDAGGAGLALAGLILGYVNIGLTILLIPIALSSFSKAREKTLKNIAINTARTDVEQICTAVGSYFSEHGKLPDGDTNVEIISRLSGSNPRNMVFLDVPKASLQNQAFIDPWSKPYAIVLDADHDGSVGVGDEQVRAQCAAWSFGLNRQDEQGKGDDIISWR